MIELKQIVHNVKVEFHIVSLRLWTLQVLIQITMFSLQLPNLDWGCYQSFHALLKYNKLWLQHMALYMMDKTAIFSCVTPVVPVIIPIANVLFNVCFFFREPTWQISAQSCCFMEISLKSQQAISRNASFSCLTTFWFTVRGNPGEKCNLWTGKKPDMENWGKCLHSCLCRPVF